MEEREIAKILLSRTGLTFDKNLIHQNIRQNYINGVDLFRRNSLNPPKTEHLLTKDYPTLRRLSSPYTDSLINLNPSKTNLKSNTILSFKSAENTPTINLSKLSYLGLSLNNPYFYNLQETFRNQNEVDSPTLMSNDDSENVKFLTLLNDLKSLYIGPSFTDKINTSRNNKLNILINYFTNSNENNDLKLDEKGCLIYKNLLTNTKFALYVDYFVKYPNEVRSKSLPLYFRELFLDKILNSQIKFSPTIHYKAAEYKKESFAPRKKRRHDKPSKQNSYQGKYTKKF